MVIKRDGRKVPFDKTKIEEAIYKAFRAVEGEVSEYAVSKAKNIAAFIEEESLKKDLDISEIQNYVENGLMATKRKDVARAYITYRNERDQQRGNITDSTIMKMLIGQDDYWKKENSNKDDTNVATQRDYIAGITSTDLAKRKLLPKEVVEAHEQGIIHQHDMDYMLQNALTNCCLINLEDMLQNGTVINGVKIDKPHKLLTATTIATQIITAVASSQYGGTTISLVHLAPFVRDSYNYYIEKYKEWGFETEKAKEYAKKDLKKEIRDSVQTFNYQINSMSTTNGQAPFLSVLMWINEDKEYIEENIMLIEEFLCQRILGMKNEKGVYITSAFPKLLYVLDENNCRENTEYWWLTELSAECTAKRMVPDYISAKKMREYKINPNTGKGEVYGCMGCRSFLTPDRTTKNYAKALNYKPNEGKYYGRFNCGVTTLNLVDIAFSSNKDFDKFWKLFDERAELCHKGLQARINRLEKITSDAAPILWQNGAFARLGKGEKLHSLLHNGYSTVSLGYAGLYECVKYMTGHSHTDGDIGEKFGLEVMEKLNEKCREWKKQENIDYSVYGTPMESGTYKFAKNLKKRFGEDIFIKLDGRDRNYISNSYHIPVFEKIDAFEKLKIESKFQKLSPGGALSYIECGDLTNNIPAILEVIKFIYDNIMYAELNMKFDYCQECGYTGEILIDENMNWYCPNCGNRDQTKMNVARRTCGYVGTHFWNYGRTQEIKERVIHLGGDQ